MRNIKAIRIIALNCLCFIIATHSSLLAQTRKSVPKAAQKPKVAPSTVALSFTVSMDSPSTHLFRVQFRCSGIIKDSIEFKMPEWTPGFYQIMNYSEKVDSFKVVNNARKELKWRKSSKNAWMVYTKKAPSITLSYDVSATRPFVAANYLDEERGYISPAGVFVHPAGMIKNPVTVTVKPYSKWNTVATGMDTVKGKRRTYYAPNYDILYDSPLLMGNLEKFPSFTVKNIPHHFVAFKPGEFDRKEFMDDLKKIVTTASGIIGEIPYKHYTFIAIGPGGGGIEHLNSTTISFTGSPLQTRQGKINIYNFLAHEYFHHYNVKRIRPIELGPFDYDNGSRTKMLWLSEGVSVYYEFLILKRAGLMTSDEFLQTFQKSIKDYEDKPGRQFETPAEASYNTWTEGPMGRTGDSVNKTISVYDKGPALGLLLDLKIRHETKNKKSLDTLMRLLYNKYYKKMGRGFTEDEFRNECEKLADTTLTDFFDYIYTLKTVDYPTYLNYAGLTIDTTYREVPGGWLGVSVTDRRDTMIITKVDPGSPAWEAGMRPQNAILNINGLKVRSNPFNTTLSRMQPGDKLKFQFLGRDGQQEKEIILGTKKERSYEIKPVQNPDELQKEILKSWMGEEM
jgi:predicted metalloprotease with PDZ domain